MDRGLTILEFDPSGSDYVHVRVAVDGHLVIPFDVPKYVYVDDFPRSEDFEAYLERQGRALLAAYGDAREGRQEPLPDFVA